MRERRAARARARRSTLVSVGVDTWGVDYGLVDAAGALLEDARLLSRRAHRRASWTRSSRVVPREEIFARTGIQFLPFNTLYQLDAHGRAGLPAAAARGCC